MIYPKEKELEKLITASKIQPNLPLAPLTTFRIGGEAKYFCLVENKDDLRRILQFCSEESFPFLTLGGGSNLLISDEGFPGLVIKLGKCFQKVSREGERVKAGAGVKLANLIQRTKTYALEGLEFLSGIPGTVGGTIITNAGTQENSIGNFVDKVGVMEKGGLKVLSREKINFSYRYSSIDGKKQVLTETEFALKKSSREQIEKRVIKNLQEKKAKQPLQFPSAGCIFKNPPEGPAAKFIEAANLKGLSRGNAQISTLHANFIINRGKATYKDVLHLIQTIQDEVYKKFRISLKPEIKIV